MEYLLEHGFGDHVVDPSRLVEADDLVLHRRGLLGVGEPYVRQSVAGLRKKDLAEEGLSLGLRLSGLLLLLSASLLGRGLLLEFGHPALS